MGQEIICRATLGSRTSEGKVLLESDHVLFGGDFRCKIFFRDLAKVAVKDGTLCSEISQSSVILAGRTAGLKDVKVVSFSPTETALKFVRPLKS